MLIGGCNNQYIPVVNTNYLIIEGSVCDGVNLPLGLISLWGRPHVRLIGVACCRGWSAIRVTRLRVWGLGSHVHHLCVKEKILCPFFTAVQV